MGFLFMRKCSLGNCSNKHYAKGFCEKHYANFRRTGNPIANRPIEYHGKRDSREYDCWANMKARCYDNKKKQYKDYGGRGITVCDRWKDSFNNFYEDMGDSNGLTLDRIDFNGNYEPTNCRWVDMTIQARNTRIRVNNKTGVKGVRWHKAAGKWISTIGIDYKEIHLGVFDCFINAVKARKEAELKYWK